MVAPKEEISLEQRIMRWVSFLTVNGLLVLAGWRTVERGQEFDRTLAIIILTISGASLGAFSIKQVINRWLK
jgi:hypothetical protein